MKKGSISIGVAIAIVALLFAGTGIALAGKLIADDLYFYQESMVEGTGLVMVDKDINTMPWNPAHNLETTLHIHGCGDYEVDQMLKVVTVKRYIYNETEVTSIQDVSQSITLCEDAEMTFKPVSLTSGSMTLIDDDTSIKWKEDLCIKNYQIGTAMRAKYTDADYIKKTIESNVTCVEPGKVDEKCDPWHNKETVVPGYGLAKMDILSTVSGASHIGVVVKDIADPHITMIRVSEDYIGNFTIEKNMKVKMVKPGISDEDDEEWLPCPWDDDWTCEGDC